MKKKFPLISILIFVLVISGYGQSNSWNGLTPLRSTRSDVEKLLGKSEKDKCFQCYYRTTKESISVTYSKGTCKEGWEVPTETVLRMNVSPISKTNKSFEELKLDKSKFSLTADDAFHGTWTNAEDGLQYNFYNIETLLTSITYIPKKSDNHLRCNGFPPFSPEGSHDTRLRFRFHDPDVSRKDNLGRIYAHSYNFIIQAKDIGNKYKSYVLVYFDNKLPLKEYERRLTLVKNYILKEKDSSQQITFIEGGMKEESEIEFYILPKEWKPPTPNPTLPSPQFMKK